MTATIASALGTDTPNGVNISGGGTLVVEHAEQSVRLPRERCRRGPCSASAHGQALGTSGTGTTTLFGAMELAGVSIDRDVSLPNGGMLAGSGTASLTGKLRMPFGGRGVIGIANAGQLTIGNAGNDLTGGGGTNPVIAVVNTGPGTGTGVVTLVASSDVVANWSLEGGTLDISGDFELGRGVEQRHAGGRTLARRWSDFSTARAITPAAAGGGISVNSKNFTLTSGLARERG